jgi:hypothetical protein
MLLPGLRRSPSTPIFADVSSDVKKDSIVVRVTERETDALPNGYILAATDDTGKPTYPLALTFTSDTKDLIFYIFHKDYHSVIAFDAHDSAVNAIAKEAVRTRTITDLVKSVFKQLAAFDGLVHVFRAFPELTEDGTNVHDVKMDDVQDRKTRLFTDIYGMSRFYRYVPVESDSIHYYDYSPSDKDTKSGLIVENVIGAWKIGRVGKKRDTGEMDAECPQSAWSGDADVMPHHIVGVPIVSLVLSSPEFIIL